MTPCRPGWERATTPARGPIPRGTARRRRGSVLAAVLLAASLPAVSAKKPEPADRASIDELWIEPKDIGSRDLFLGAGGSASVPDAKVAYRVTGKDTKGHSHGWDVVGPDGRAWDVKEGEESKTEIAVSRILWAIGYHQPVMHRLETWRMEGPGETPPPGRFRLASDHKTKGDWSWNDNPFVGTRPYHGLIVANLVVNNWDLTTTQNRVYQVHGAQPEQWYVVQDVGGSLGKSRWPTGTRDDIDEFEKQNLIESVKKDGTVDFLYLSRHRGLVKGIPKEDVLWVCRLLDQLSEKQLDDAFRAAGYPKDVRDRYVKKIRSKIAEGLAVGGDRGKA